MTGGLWLRHASNFGEHPKTLRLRRLAGKHADAAECGWWRILESAKRYGSWEFDDEEHLENAAGRYSAHIPLYRQVGFLDGLIVHNGDEYQAPMTGGERVAKHRASNAGHVTGSVTPVTPRAEQSREERAEHTGASVTSDPADIYWQLTGKYPGDKVLPWIDETTGKYGAEATIAALAAAHIEDRQVGTLWGRVVDILRAGARQLDRQEKVAEQAALREKRAKPRTLEPWQEEFRAAVERQYLEFRDPKPQEATR